VSHVNALQQWRAGENRLARALPERRAALERVTERIYNDLRRRLGGTFRVAELVALYEADTGWCLDVAVAAAPDSPWAWEATTVVDAAFGRYLREAADYAGGRLSNAES
jgi:hypothetical protein